MMDFLESCRPSKRRAQPYAPRWGQLFYSMHVNNRLYDQVKEQVDSMRCRLVRAQKQRVNCWVIDSGHHITKDQNGGFKGKSGCNGMQLLRDFMGRALRGGLVDKAREHMSSYVHDVYNIRLGVIRITSDYFEDSFLPFCRNILNIKKRVFFWLFQIWTSRGEVCRVEDWSGGLSLGLGCWGRDPPKIAR